MIPEQFDLASMTKYSSAAGERHLHESMYSCTHLFSFPNGEGLKGVAPHIHSYCDDIELLIEGEIVVPRPHRRGIKVPAPFLIINPTNTVHAFVVAAGNASVLGYRSPKSYQGQELLSQWLTEGIITNGSEDRPVFIDLSTTRNLVQETRNTIVRLHAVDGCKIIKSMPYRERVFFSFEKSIVEISSANNSFELMRHGLTILPGQTNVVIRSDKPGTIVELIAKSGYAEI